VYSFKVFSAVSSLCEVLVSAGLGGVSAGLGGAMRMYRHSCAFGAYSGGVAMRRAPKPGPLRLVCTPFRRPFAGQEGEASTAPIERVANRGFLTEVLSGDSSGLPCPI
jgi:hypothetical protein